MKNISQPQIELELITLTGRLLAEQGTPYRRDIDMDDSLQRQLGIDSLSRAELFQRIEKSFSITIPERLLVQAESLRDIAAYLQHAEPVLDNRERPQIITGHGAASLVDPAKARTLQEIVLMYGEQSPEKPHIFFQNEDGNEEIVTYGELLTASMRVANSLRDRGLKPGETVAIMYPTSPTFFYIFMGVLFAGGVPVPIYPPFRMHMLEAYARTEAKILGSAEVRMLITFADAQKLSKLLQGFVPSLRQVVIADDLLHAEAAPIIPNARMDQPAFIQYTSGSTNDPKGVLLSHYNLLSNIAAYGKGIKITPSDIVVSWLPLYHDFGLIGAWLGSLYHGVPLILMTPFSFLSHPERWLWMIHYHRGTLTGAPNFAYELCVNKIDPAKIEGLDLSSWRVAANGAEKVYPRTLEAFAKKFEPYGLNRKAIMPVYGLAESTVGLLIPPLGRDFRVDHVDRVKFEEERQAVPSDSKQALEFAGCGMPIEGHEVRIVDDNIQELPERHVGRLQFKGPSSMQGYYNNPTATNAILHDGWYDSGDLAYQADGEFFITGRRKDLIIKAGRNIYPAEIEELVGNVPGVRQGCVAAFGTVDEKSGTEILVVVAETKETNAQKRQEMRMTINDVIATALDMPVDEIILVAPRTVPKTSSGKLQRAACKNMYLAGKIGKKHMSATFQVVKLSLEWAMRKILGGLTVLAKAFYTAYIAVLVLITSVPLYLLIRFGSSAVAARTAKSWAQMILFMGGCYPKVKSPEKMISKKSLIFAANHASYTDAIIAIAVAPVGVRFVIKKEAFNAPILGILLAKLNHIPVDRVDLSKGLEDTKEIDRALRDGQSIFIFPEGTFGYAKGLRPFRLGAFKIAAEAGVAICPIAIKGARTLFRDEDRVLTPTAIEITVCDHMHAEGTEWQDITNLRAAVRSEIAKHCGEPSLDMIAAHTIAPGASGT